MFSRRKRFHDLMDELDRFIEELEKDVEKTVRGLYESGEKFFSKPMVYGFSMKIGPDGEPVLRTFGDRRMLEEGFREPVHDQFVDEGRGELKLFAELPGVEKEDIQLQSTETRAVISAVRGDRKYRSEIELRAPVDPSTATAVYKNGVLEATFRLKEKTNKGFTNVRID